MKIYLTGFMGAGKSTFGAKLTEALGYRFLDLDVEIATQARKSIPELFNKDDDSEFRKLEQVALLNTREIDNTVIATGGGTAAFQNNMTWMNEQGITVYLKLFEPELIRRLKEEGEARPLIKDLDDEQLQEFVHTTLRARAPYYTQAQITIDPLSITAEELAEQLKAS